MSVKVVNGVPIRIADGARWSAILGDWVIPRRQRKGIVVFGLAGKSDAQVVLPVVTLKPKRHTRVKRSQSNRSALRNRLAEAQNWCCCYCGCVCDGEEDDWVPATIEHVVELSKGGSDDWENLVMACYPCNDERGNKLSAEEFYQRKQQEKTK